MFWAVLKIFRLKKKYCPLTFPPVPEKTLTALKAALRLKERLIEEKGI